jgi:alpha-galactosidase
MRTTLSLQVLRLLNAAMAFMAFCAVGDAGEGNNFDHADWAGARFTFIGEKPRTTGAPKEEAVILTPKPPAAPRINGPTVYGCRPGKPFLYRIPTTGQRPISFSAEGLPEGLALDFSTGIITGAVARRGEHAATLSAKNAQGSAVRKFKIVCGDTLALTPPMGWNDWYCHYDRISDKLVREAADAMVRSGMADVGYQYVNIDDCWMNASRNKDPLRVGPLRDAAGNILPNKHFPDMKALTDYIHAKGLKAGLYTSPGPRTCAGFAGSYRHEAQDAKQFAAWGFDFLKYDWCSYGEVSGGNGLPQLKKPYELMWAELKKQDRDIVFNLCQYGMGDVWKWGGEVGHCWRTGGDLGFELNRIFPIALRNVEFRRFNKPGQWNDPDYIQIGCIGNAAAMGEPHPCGLTPNEQYSFMSLWCLLAAPLIYSGDMNRLDEFTLNVLCNPEVIDVDQDPLGQCARKVAENEDTFVLVKDMEDGSKAVGLCNGGEIETNVTAKWPALGVAGKQIVRDLWRQRDLGAFADEFSAPVGRHGVVLVRIRPESATATR